MKKDELEIEVKKLKGRGDSFWYDGVIATLGDYTLIACGEVSIAFEPNATFYSHHQALEEAYERKYTDKQINKIFNSPDDLVRNNNWFEVILPDNETVMGDVAYDYDEAIKMLKTYHAEKI